MKNYDLTIINSENQNLVFDVYEPETVKEALCGLSNMHLKDNQGMVYFPISNSGSPCIHPEWITTKATYFPVDFVFINWNGTIVQIDTVPALLDETHINSKAVCVLELNAGTCEKMKISIGDNILHKRLYRLLDNRILFNEKAFTDLKKASYDQITEIVAFAYLYPEIILLFASSKAFFIDATNYDYDKVCQIIPLWAEIKKSFFTEHPDCDIYIVNAGQLFIKHEYNTAFLKKIGNKTEVSNRWIETLLSLI